MSASMITAAVPGQGRYAQIDTFVGIQDREDKKVSMFGESR